MVKESEYKFVEWSRQISSDDFDVVCVSDLLNSIHKSKFSIVDVGGGNGRFAEACLAQCRSDVFCTVVDSSDLVVEEVPVSDNLSFEHSDFFDSVVAGADDTYECVIFKTVLHHLIHSSEAQTLESQKLALATELRIIKNDGKLVIVENFYDGLFGSDLPGRIIFYITRLRFVASLVRAFGANTAGEGVRFRSLESWKRLLSEEGFRIVSLQRGPGFKMRFLQKMLFLCRDRYQACLIAEPI